MNTRHKFTLLLGTALIALAACRFTPNAPTGVTAMPGNTEVILSWAAVMGATSYNVYTSSSVPVTTGSAKTSVTAPGATLSSLANGAVVYAAVTAVNAAGESPLSAMVCAVPTAASTAGLTLYDPLCGSTLDGRKWQTPLFTRGVENGALVLRTQISNMESRLVRGLNYATIVNVNAGGQRVTTLKADVNVPSSTLSRSGEAAIRTVLVLAYQPPADRLFFPRGQLNSIVASVGLVDSGSGLKAHRRIFHIDNPSNTSRSVDGIALSDPAGFTPDSEGIGAEASASFDTTYSVSVSLNESTGVFSWSITGGSFGADEGTADPAVYLAGNASWTTLGPNPLASPAFTSASLRIQLIDDSLTAGSAASASALFQNVHVGFGNAPAAPWDDFSGTGGNSGPTELSAAKWTAPGKVSTALADGTMIASTQSTSPTPAGVVSFQSHAFSDPVAINTMQADVTVGACSNSVGGSNRVHLEGTFYNDGSPGTTPPNINQPNSRVGDVRAQLMLDCVTRQVSYQIFRLNGTLPPTLLTSFGNSTISTGVGAVTGSTHTMTLSWDPATHFFTFQLDGSAPVVVDPTTTNDRTTVAAPYVMPANSPFRQLLWGTTIPPVPGSAGATAAMEFRVNNVFTGP